jgi:hypothetical protein
MGFNSAFKGLIQCRVKLDSAFRCTTFSVELKATRDFTVCYVGLSCVFPPVMAGFEIRKLKIWKINVHDSVRIRDNNLNGKVLKLFHMFLNL